MDIIEELKEASKTLDNIANQTESLKDTKIAYTNYRQEFDKIKNYQTNDFYLVKTDNTNRLKFGTYVSELNGELSSHNEKWDTSCPNNFHSCQEGPVSSHTEQYCITFSSCVGKNPSNWHTSDNSAIVSAFIDSIKLAKHPTSEKSVEKALSILNDKYTAYLTTQTGSLKVFNDTINKLTGIFTDFTGENDIYSILNCKFIGRNVKVILKYLDKALGTNFYTVGVCLLIAGISMCISISLTILLNIIININIPGQSNNDNIVNVQYMGDPNLGGDAFHGVETEKVRYEDNNENINVENINEEDLNNGVKVINYNN